MIKNIKNSLILIFLLIAFPVHAQSWLENVIHSPLYSLGFAAATTATCVGTYFLCKKCAPALMRTHAGFYVSRLYNKIMYGSTFTCNQMAGDEITDAVVDTDENGNILAINDGKSPLFLGSIPATQAHIEHLKKLGNQEVEQAKVIIFTLNEQWECNAVGLYDLAKNNQLIHKHYATPDFSAPLFVDVLRAVRDIDARDNNGTCSASLVHCKAGRARSATIVGAYLAHVVYEATKKSTTVDAIKKYMVARRTQVDLHDAQQAVLQRFIQELDEAKSLQALLQKYHTDIAARDAQLGAAVDARAVNSL